MNRILFFGAIIMCAFFALANPGSRKFLPESEEPATVIKEEPLVYVRSLDVKIRANELAATTTLEMEIYNQGDRLMDGEVEFSLSEGQVISGFQLDIGKNMREGVIVEKKKAIKTYEAIVNRKVDPGLLELTAGNNYRLRVYPVPAHGSRKVSITIDQEMKPAGNELVYSLPVLFSRPIENYNLQIRVENTNQIPQVRKGFLENLTFDANRLLYEQKNVMLSSPHSFAIPINREELKVCVDSRNYFSARIPYAIPEKDDIRSGSLSVFWDVSSSAKNRDINKELDFLQAFLEKSPFRKVRVIAFNNEMQETREYDEPHTKINLIRSFLQSLHFDGATNLEILNNASLMLDQNMLFSDGINNFGQSNFIIGKPLHTILSSAVADPLLLKYLAASTGGHFVEIGSGEVMTFVEKMSTPSEQFVKAKGQNVSDLIAKSYDGFVRLSGRLDAGSGKVELVIGKGRSRTMPVVIHSNNNCGEDLSWAAWRAAKINWESLINYNVEEKIRATGSHLGIVTAFTSLIVLETIEDYIQFDILPPEELMEVYNKNVIVQNKKKEVKPSSEKPGKASSKIINDLVSQKENRKEWWKKSFPLKPQKNNALARGSTSTSADSTGVQNVVGFTQRESRSANVTGSAPPPPAAPTVVNIDKEITIVMKEEDTRLNEVVVTAYAPQRRMQSLSYSVGKVSSEELSINPVNTPEASGGKGEPMINKTKLSSVGRNEKEKKRLTVEQLLSLDKSEIYANYLLQKELVEENDPSFYMEVSGKLYSLGYIKEAKRVLSNLAELELEDHQLLKAMAYVFESWKDYPSAIFLYEKILDLRDDEPQSYRDLALAKNAKGEHQQAVELLYKVLTSDLQKSTDQFNGILAIMLNELNAIIEKHGKKLNLDKIDKTILSSMPVDLRIVVDWNKDQTDIDLHILEPGNEKCNYQFQETKNGGLLSEDLTEGYGPEEYSIRRAVKGKYKISVDYYGDNYQKEQVPSFIKISIYRNFGRPDETVEIKNMYMKGKEGIIDVAEIIIE